MPLILLRYRAFLPVSSSEPERRRGYDGQERNATDPSEVDRKHDFIGNAGNRQHDADHRTDGQRTDHATVPLTPMAFRISVVSSMTAIVMPETGVLLLPTIPTMRAEPKHRPRDIP